MAEAALIALAVGGAAAGGYTSYESARKQNAAAKASARAAKTGAAVQERQLTVQTQAEQRRRLLEKQRTMARIRVLGAESGFAAESGDIESLLDQADFDSSTNAEILRGNLSNNLARVRSGLDADLSSLRARIQNSLLSGLTGSLSGAAAGLQIGQAGQQIFRGGVDSPVQPVGVAPLGASDLG